MGTKLGSTTFPYSASVYCGGCGAEILRIEKGFQLVITSMNYMCAYCENSGFFELIAADTIQDLNDSKSDTKSEKDKK